MTERDEVETRFTLRLPEELIEKIDERRYAKKGNLSRNQYIIDVLVRYFYAPGELASPELHDLTTEVKGLHSEIKFIHERLREEKEYRKHIGSELNKIESFLGKFPRFE